MFKVKLFLNAYFGDINFYPSHIEHLDYRSLGKFITQPYLNRRHYKALKKAINEYWVNDCFYKSAPISTINCARTIIGKKNKQLIDAFYLEPFNNKPDIDQIYDSINFIREYNDSNDLLIQEDKFKGIMLLTSGNWLGYLEQNSIPRICDYFNYVAENYRIIFKGQNIGDLDKLIADVNLLLSTKSKHPLLNEKLAYTFKVFYDKISK